MIRFTFLAVLYIVVPTALQGLYLTKLWYIFLVCLIFHCLYPNTVMTFIQQKGTNVLLTCFYNVWIIMNRQHMYYILLNLNSWSPCSLVLMCIITEV